MAAVLKACPASQHGLLAIRWSSTTPTALIVSEHSPLATAAENSACMEEHSRFANETSNRTFVISKNSGHLVMTHRPDLVTYAVVTTAKAARGHAAPLRLSSSPDNVRLGSKADIGFGPQTGRSRGVHSAPSSGFPDVG